MQVIDNEIVTAVNNADEIARTLVRHPELESTRIAAEYDSLADHLDHVYEKIDGYLREVPVDWSTVDFPRGDRLAATKYLANFMAPARHRIDVCDRFLDGTLLLFLDPLPRNLTIRLVTTRSGIDRVLPLAKAARTQFRDLHLLEATPKQFHMRCLRVDEHLLRFDQTIRDLALSEGAHFGVPVTEGEVHADLDALITNSTEIALT